MSVHMSAYIIWETTEQISIKFGIGIYTKVCMVGFI
jgi:hypothetical protein